MGVGSHTGFIECRKMALKILETWGDQFYSGLTGIEFYDEKGQKISISTSSFNAKPRDLREENNPHDVRILENLNNGINQTTDDKNMWLVSYSEGVGASVFVNFGCLQKVGMMKIWNYNKSPIDSSRGIKRISILADIT